MAGNDEGINAWMTVNFLLGSLGGTGKSDLLILGPLLFPSLTGQLVVFIEINNVASWARQRIQCLSNPKLRPPL